MCTYTTPSTGQRAQGPEIANDLCSIMTSQCSHLDSASHSNNCFGIATNCTARLDTGAYVVEEGGEVALLMRGGGPADEGRWPC